MINAGFFEKFLFTFLNENKKYLLSEKINSIFTPSLFISAAILISTKEYFGNPINCITPSHFIFAWQQYAENYCFLTNVYNVENNEELPFEKTVRSSRSFNYYSWIPLTLVIEASLFYAPLIFWKYQAKGTFLYLQQYFADGTKKELINNYIRQLKSASWKSKFTFSYLLLKVAHIFNVILQFFILSEVLDFSFLSWG